MFLEGLNSRFRNESDFLAVKQTHYCKLVCLDYCVSIANTARHKSEKVVKSIERRHMDVRNTTKDFIVSETQFLTFTTSHQLEICVGNVKK